MQLLIANVKIGNNGQVDISWPDASSEASLELGSISDVVFAQGKTQKVYQVWIFVIDMSSSS